MAQKIESAYNAGDPVSIPGSGRYPGDGNGNPLQYSCLENPVDGRASPRDRKESDTTESLHFLEGKKIQHVSIHFRNERTLTSHRAEIPASLPHFSLDLSREMQKKLKRREKSRKANARY